MDDDDEPIGSDGYQILYDYLKHVTSLCLFSLGGIAALTEKIQGKSKIAVIAALAIVGLAAFCSFYASGMIVEARVSDKPIRGNINLYRHASPLLLSVGIGMFLYLFFASQTA